MTPAVSASSLAIPAELHVGADAAELVAPSIARLGRRRPVVVTDPNVRHTGHPDRLVDQLSRAGYQPTVWSRVDPDASEGCVTACAEELRRLDVDVVVAVGGGTVIDVGKAAAAFAAHEGRLRDYFGLDRLVSRGIDVIAVPTTLGNGSEVSRHAVVTSEEQRRVAVSGPLSAPRVVVLDPGLAATVSDNVVLDNGVDSLLHAIEAHLARRATPITDLFALGAIPLLSGSIVGAVEGDSEHRGQLALGSLYAGIAMANTNAGAVHALGYPLTNRYGIRHGRANALVAPAALDRMRLDSTAAQRRVADAWEGPRPRAAGDGVAPLFRALLDELGIDGSLASHGVAEDELPLLAAQATEYRPVLTNAPSALDEAALLGIYRACWSMSHGRGSLSSRR